MRETRIGLVYGFAAYLVWGAFPFYFGLIGMVSPFEIVPWRVSLTLVFCAVLVTTLRRWDRVAVILRRPRQLAWFALGSLLLYTNWQLFVLGVLTGHVLETSLGYFINPLVTVLLGVVIRHEKLSGLQWTAVVVAAVGVVIAAVGYGQFPWIALGLAFSFGLYGAIHKHAGEDVDGVTGLTVETLTTVPVAIVQLIVVGALTGIGAFSFGPGIAILVLASGVLTALPLILFGEASRRLPLAYLGFLQFLTPILSFVYGYFVTHEEVSAARWIGFCAVWVAIGILLVDVMRRSRGGPVVHATTGPIPLE